MTKIISNFQFILDENSRADTVISCKFIAKKKSSVLCYVVDNVKMMIRCLQKEGIVGNDEDSCLIKSFSNKGRRH